MDIPTRHTAIHLQFLLLFLLLQVRSAYSQCRPPVSGTFQFKETVHYSGSATLLTIPVVVHVCHQNGPENISDAQVLSQMEVLNKDFRKRNSDTVNTNPVFQSLTADMEIEFCLASVDPTGMPTNGIDRIFTTETVSTQLISMYGWDPSKYMNIYVTPGTGCFSSFPWSAPTDDGVFITHGRFGTTGTAGSEQFAEFATLGRTATHEAGHYLGLYHTFSFCDTNCYAEDSVCDTPPADMRWAISNCMSHATNTCNETPDLPDLVDNFMDYNTDSCMNMFTAGQKQRVWDAVNTYRSYLVSDSNLVATGCGSIVSVDENLRNRFIVFPNPANDFLTVYFPYSKFPTVIIRDIKGRELYRERFMEKSTIDVSRLAAGVYILTLSDGIITNNSRLSIVR